MNRKRKGIISVALMMLMTFSFVLTVSAESSGGSYYYNYRIQTY